MLIEAGLKSIWPDFSLEIQAPLDFAPGAVFHLEGPNGSGKSSFIKQLLLPRLLEMKDVYTLYFEQQMHYQLQAVKAYASLIKPRLVIVSEEDAVVWLLKNLQDSLTRKKRPSYTIMDESSCEAKVREFLRQRVPDCCLVFSSHAEKVPEARTIVFEPVSTQLSKVYVSRA